MKKQDQLTEIADEEQVRQVMDEWHRLTAEEDVEGLLDLTTDDVVFLTPGNEPIRKQDFAAGLRQFLPKARVEMTQDVKEIEVSGDLAYAWSHLSIDLIPKDGRPRSRSAGYVMTLFQRSRDGRWRMSRDANLVLGAGNPDRI